MTGKSKQEVEAVRGLLPEKLGEDAIRVIVKEIGRASCRERV